MRVFCAFDLTYFNASEIKALKWVFYAFDLTYFNASEIKALKWESSVRLSGVWDEMTVSNAPSNVCLAVMAFPPTMSKWNDWDNILAGDSLYSLPC